MNDLPETLEQLSARVNALERRVHDLEEHAASPALPEMRTAAASLVSAPVPNLASGEQISSAFLLLGKAMLGIAGAYLLRALAESAVLPRLLLAAVAIAYAIGWLMAASRVAARLRFASALYAGTSALILAPMLWELTMRFHVLNAVASAAVLALFVAVSTALSWNHHRAPDFTVACIAAAITALALSIATHEMIVFLLLQLAMLALCEYKSVRGGALGVHILVAAAADCAAWFLIVIYRLPASERPDYATLETASLIAPASLLLAITAAAVIVKTAVLRRPIRIFETTQCVIAFLLWVLSALFLLPQFSARVVGAICLLFAGACYAAAYGLFRHSAELRNFHVFALWSVALFLGGIFLTLPAPWAIACLALASVASAGIATRICCTTLECHGVIYLGVTALACGRRVERISGDRLRIGLLRGRPRA